MLPPFFTSTASNPGYFDISHEKLARLHPGLFPGSFWYWVGNWYVNPNELIQEIAYLLHEGDCRAAVVISLEPLLIAAYSDEFDAVVLLRFPSWLAPSYDLALGGRLITVNNYIQTIVTRQTDFRRGPQDTGQFSGFIPLIANFLTDDQARLAKIKQTIPEAEWQRAHKLGLEKAAQRWPPPRNGRPRYSRYDGGQFYEGIGVVVAMVAIVAVIIFLALR